jgi:hypothetical protein
MMVSLLALTLPQGSVSKNAGMAFGQQSGPPASAKQVRELLELLKGAGHSDFRDARGPMGFTQRQAAGKFSRDEATEFITQLLDAESEGDSASAPPMWRQSAQEQVLSSLPTDQLADELRRRGWTAIEPQSPTSGAPARGHLRALENEPKDRNDK